MIADLLAPHRVMLDLSAAPKAALLGEMVRRLAESGDVESPDSVLDLLVRREELITTGVKTGFAFPHAFTPHAPRLILSVGAVRGGTDFQSLDGRPVEFVFLLLGPPARQETHLRVLARLSRVAGETGALEALREAADAEAIARLLGDSDRSIATLS
jgi:mannitol/fructose-specific phosphotransferase system IIA component (Ntr-type)